MHETSYTDGQTDRRTYTQDLIHIRPLNKRLIKMMIKGSARLPGFDIISQHLLFQAARRICARTWPTLFLCAADRVGADQVDRADNPASVSAPLSGQPSWRTPGSVSTTYRVSKQKQ